MFYLNHQVTLDDIMNGVTKKMKISRSRPNQYGGFSTEPKILELNIKKGWKVSSLIEYKALKIIKLL